MSCIIAGDGLIIVCLTAASMSGFDGLGLSTLVALSWHAQSQSLSEMLNEMQTHMY